MTLIEQLKKRYRTMVREHHASKPRPSGSYEIDGSASYKLLFIPEEPRQTPLPTKLRIGYDTFDELRCCEYDPALDSLRMKFLNADIEVVDPDDIEAPGWELT